jgi:hypothetical protein
MSGRRTKLAREALRKGGWLGRGTPNPEMVTALAKQLGVNIRWLRRQLRGGR